MNVPINVPMKFKQHGLSSLVRGRELEFLGDMVVQSVTELTPTEHDVPGGGMCRGSHGPATIRTRRIEATLLCDHEYMTELTVRFQLHA